MATNKPTGDNARKGAVRKRTQLRSQAMGESTWTKRNKSTGKFMEQKKAALLAHQSQLGPEVAEYISKADAYTARQAGEKGFGKMAFAEQFYKLFTGALASDDARRLAFPRRYPTEPGRVGRPHEAAHGGGAPVK